MVQPQQFPSARRVSEWLLAASCLLVPALGWCDDLQAAADSPAATASYPPARYRLADAWHDRHAQDPDRPQVALAPDQPTGHAEFFYSLPSQFTYDTLDSLRRPSLLSAFEHAQTTVRYAWISRSGWSFKLGVVSALDLDSPTARLAYFPGDRSHQSWMPLMHLAGETPISTHWLVSVDAQSQHWVRTQSLDLDLKLDYRLTSNLDIYGAYRLSDSLADGIDPGFAPAPANLARFGLRLRF